MIKLLIGGSPCTHWSVAQNKNRETTSSGIGWELFVNYLIAKERFKPDYFLYENNKSAATAIKQEIGKELDVEIMHINSALLSAQNRERFYAFNWAVDIPKDKKIFLKDVVITPNGAEPTAVNLQVVGRKRNENGVFERSWEARIDRKASTITSIESRRMVAIPITTPSYGRNIYEIKDGLITVKGKQYPIKLADGFYEIRPLTVEECCELQTLPKNYCKSVTKTQAYKGLANCWTAEIIIHILSAALANVNKNEKIVVLSMYDGIGTGRYCLDKMGFTNVEYYAIEIDDHAKKVANDNYPDIIQCGNAFQMRDNTFNINGLLSEVHL